MKKILLSFTMVIMLVAIAGISMAQSLNPAFSWTPNSEADLAGYNIYCGVETGVLPTKINMELPSIEQGQVVYTLNAADCGIVENGTYYFAATAYDNGGNESGMSQEVEWTAPDIAPEDVKDFTTISIVVNPDGSIVITVTPPTN